MLKKWIYIMLSLVLMGCQKEEISSPEQEFKNLMYSLKTGDFKNVEKYLDDSPTNFSYDRLIQWMNQEELDDLLDELEGIFRDINYTMIESENVLPEAVLTVHIETKDYGKFIDEMYISFIGKYLLSSNKDIKEELIDYLEDGLDDFKTKYQKEVKVYMIYQDGWKLDRDKNRDFYDALSGGAYTKIQSFLF